MLKNISFLLKCLAVGLLVGGVFAFFLTGQSLFLEIAAFAFIAICFILSLFMSVSIVKGEIRKKKGPPIFIALPCIVESC